MKMKIKNLQELLIAMKSSDPSVTLTMPDGFGGFNAGDWIRDLPTFGGSEPDDTDGVWSWDEKNLIVGTCADDIEIVRREDREEGGDDLYIVIREEGEDDTLLLVNTEEQCVGAEATLFDLGIESEEVWTGEAPDAVKTDMIIFAEARQ